MVANFQNMKLLYLLLTISGTILAARHVPSDPLSDEYIKYINSLNTTWQAGRNFHVHTSTKYIKALMGVNSDIKDNKLSFKSRKNNNQFFPKHFDSRLNWDECPSIAEINDQGDCGSCWAVAATEVMSDRICIHSNAQINVRLSAQNVLSCYKSFAKGCEGGNPVDAWQHWIDKGIVTGGSYDSKKGCIPYKEAPCGLSITGKLKPCYHSSVHLSMCSKMCQIHYKNSYKEDLYHGRSVYRVSNKERSIQAEIATNGPVQAVFTVYEDFLSYKKGVYEHVAGKKLGKHAVRIIGWGVEKKTPYWLVANTWNTNWGDEGFFKIIRGEDECGIESEIIAGLPEKPIKTKSKNKSKNKFKTSFSVKF